MNVSSDKAQARGLGFRPLADTARDVIEGTRALYPEGYDLTKQGQEGHIDSATEQRLIAELLESGMRVRV